MLWKITLLKLKAITLDKTEGQKYDNVSFVGCQSARARRNKCLLKVACL